MLRNKIKRTLAGGMCGLIALALLVINSATSGNAAADVLSNSEMSKIVGMCGCHAEDNDKGCDENVGNIPDECGGSCTSYKLAGSNPDKCVWKAPKNDAHCEKKSVDPVCHTPYSCSSDSKWTLKCEGTACEGGFLLDFCDKCECTAGDPERLSSYYCDG